MKLNTSKTKYNKVKKTTRSLLHKDYTCCSKVSFSAWTTESCTYRNNQKKNTISNCWDCFGCNYNIIHKANMSDYVLWCFHFQDSFSQVPFPNLLKFVASYFPVTNKSKIIELVAILNGHLIITETCSFNEDDSFLEFFSMFFNFFSFSSAWIIFPSNEAANQGKNHVNLLLQHRCNSFV